MSGPRIARTEQDMETLGTNASKELTGGLLIFLRGDLGTGKTTWVRGLLRGLGYTGKVKSPTYTLLEPYNLDSLSIYHFDLYRLNDPHELEDLAFREYLGGHGVCCIEWPERGGMLLPKPDCELVFNHNVEGRVVIPTHHTSSGERLCANM